MTATMRSLPALWFSMKSGMEATPGLDLVAQHVAHHRRAAAVGRGLQVQLVLAGQHADQEFGDGRGRGNADAVPPALLLHVAHVIGHRLRGGAAGQRQRIGEAGEARHRDEVHRGIEARALRHQGQDGNRMVVAQEQRMAVGWRGLQRLGGDLATGAGAVLDYHRHAELVLQLLGQRAGDRVRAASRREADQDAHRRGGLRLRDAGGEGDEAGHQQAAQRGKAGGQGGHPPRINGRAYAA
jgi:hypothetical protein